MVARHTDAHHAKRQVPVAIPFADDLFMIAQNTTKLQLSTAAGRLLHCSVGLAVRSQVEVDDEGLG
jgi:hypothetical protein